MKRCNVVLNGGSYINVAADRMKVEDNMLYVSDGENLVVLAEVTAIISAHLSEKGEQYAG